jgi:predicted dehydrogenase
LGQVEALHARFWSGDRDDLLNNGIHIFDIVQCLGGPVKGVYARSFDGNVVAIVQFESGAIGSLFLTGKIDITPGVWHSIHERVEVIGSKNRVLVVENGRRIHISGEGSPLSTWDPPQVLHWVTGYNIAGFAGEWRHFLDCIASGKPSAVGVETGISSIRLKEGIERSLDEQRTVDLQEYQSQLEFLSN